MSSTPARWPSCHLFDVRIDALTTAQVMEAFDASIAERRRLLISVVNAAKMVNIDRDSGLRRAVLGADLILADGMSIVWACRFLRTPIPERVTGIDLMMRMLQRCSERNHRVYFLGAKDEVLAQAIERVRRDYPGAEIVGHRNGYYSADEEEQVAREIAAAKPDVLFVGMSSPRKEKFIAHYAHLMGVPVYHGVGGAFDVMAGKVRRAPGLVQSLGLEWAFRMLQEPRRLFKRYLDTNSVFVARVLREAARSIRRSVFGAPSPAATPLRRVRVSHD